MKVLHDNLLARLPGPGEFITRYKPTSTSFTAQMSNIAATSNVETTVMTASSASTFITDLPHISEGWVLVLVPVLLFLISCSFLGCLVLHDMVQKRKAYAKLSPDEQRRWRRDEYLDERVRRWRDNEILSPDNEVDITPQASRVTTPFPHAKANGCAQVEARQLKQRLSKLVARAPPGTVDVGLDGQEIHGRYQAVTPSSCITRAINELLVLLHPSEPLLQAQSDGSPVLPEQTHQEQHSPSGLSCFEQYGAYPDSIAISSAEPLLPKLPKHAQESTKNSSIMSKFKRSVEELARLVANKYHTEVEDDPEKGLLLPVRDEERDGSEAAHRIRDLEKGL